MDCVNVYFMDKNLEKPCDHIPIISPSALRMKLTDE